MESTGYDTIIVGDFNLSFISWDIDNTLRHSKCTTARNYANRLGYSLIDFMAENNMLQLNTVKNRYNRTLDVIFSNFYGGSVSECNNPLSTVDGYHPPVEITISNISITLLKNKIISKLNFRRANYAIINGKLNNIDWIKILSDLPDVDDMVHVLYTHIGTIIDECVPYSKVHNSKFPAWFPNHLISLLNEKEKIRTRYIF